MISTQKKKSFRSLGNKNEVTCQGGSGWDVNPERGGGGLEFSDAPGLETVCSSAPAEVEVFILSLTHAII